jgi:hypothetical protein
MIEKTVMTIGELLAWSHEETTLANALEAMKSTLPEEVHPALEKQIRARRERASWLDHQVERAMDLNDRSGGP